MTRGFPVASFYRRFVRGPRRQVRHHWLPRCQDSVTVWRFSRIRVTE